MKLNCRNTKSAITRKEVIVTIAVLAILTGILLPAVVRMRERARRTWCISNLRQGSLSFRQWAIDNTNSYPMGLSTSFGATREYAETGAVFRHFQAMSNVLITPRILACPSDSRRPAKDFVSLSNTNISYFVGLDTDETHPQMFLMGDRNLTNGALLPDGILELKSNSVVGWTEKMHNMQGNIPLSDGSVMGSNNRMLRDVALNAGDFTNRLALPLD